MLTKRIIPCLDIKDGRTVKGVNFVNLRDAGDPVELAQRYAEAGADELVFRDISASEEKRKTLAKLVHDVAQAIDIPFTVGGGINATQDVGILLDNGADKVSINSAAVRRPALISEVANRFGTQCVVVAIDAKQIASEWIVHLVGGKVPTERKLFSWAKEAVDRGAGELLFTSMNHDGTKQGFANTALRQLSETVTVPVIASGGVGTLDHLHDGIVKGGASAVLAASIFHYGEFTIKDTKEYLKSKNIPVRL